jgi:hypothetical protein
MKVFLLSVLQPHAILVVDVSNISQKETAPSHQFPTWREAEKFLTEQGATPDIVKWAARSILETGVAKITF